MDRDQGLSRGGIQLDEGPVRTEAGVIDQEIKLQIGDASRQPMQGGPGSKIDDLDLNVGPMLSVQPLGKRPQPFFAAGDHNEIVAGCRELFREGRTNAGGGAGDKGTWPGHRRPPVPARCSRAA
jgi:hypothetical protein